MTSTRRAFVIMPFGEKKTPSGTAIDFDAVYQHLLSRREIPMAPLVANTLREWKLACPTTVLDLVFPSERGEVIWHTNLYKQCFLALLTNCELMIVLPAMSEGRPPRVRPPYNFHGLRHAAASLFIEQGWTPKKIQTLMGHSSIQVTFDIYGRLFPSPEDDVKAMAQIEARLLGG